MYKNLFDVNKSHITINMKNLCLTRKDNHIAGNIK